MAQLAAISNVSKAEMNEIVENAVIGECFYFAEILLKLCVHLSFKVFCYFYTSNKLYHIVELMMFFADSGGDEKEAKKLSKEMRQELVRAKSNLGEQCE